MLSNWLLSFFMCFIGRTLQSRLFWDEMAPPDEAKKTKPSDALAAAIDKSFGSMDEMRSHGVV